MAGVTAGAVTKALRTHLKSSLVGPRIDILHPTAVKYLADKSAAPPVKTDQPASGIDPLYEDAIAVCKKLDRYSVNNIAQNLSIGVPRAKRIYAMMVAANMHESKSLVNGYRAKVSTKKSESLESLNTVEEIESGSVVHEVPDDINLFADMTLRELIHRFGTDTAFVDWLKATKSIEDINEKRLKNAVTRGELVNRDLMKKGVIDPINTAMQRLLTDGAKTMARRVTAMTASGRSVEDCEKYIIDNISSFIGPMKTKISRNYKNA